MRKLNGFWKCVVSILSIALILFHLCTSYFGIYPDLIQRSVHLGFVLTLCYLLQPISKKHKGESKVPVYDIAFACISAITCLYLLYIYNEILWDPFQWVGVLDKVFAIILVLLILEAGRRTVGWIFIGLVSFFLIYAYFGPYFPGMWAHSKFSFDSIFQTLYHGTNGIWGLMVGISATMLAMFGIFSGVLSVTGGADTFVKIGENLFGNATGGPGKVALVASGLFGMISGSAIGNVVATGTFTIPLMKKANYSKEWSASISAVGSTGGQIMPPIMGAGAFIMAQLLGVSYLSIAKAAIIPAVLYYLASFTAVHCISLRDNIKGVVDGRGQIAFLDYFVIFVPLLLFILLLIKKYTITTGAFWASLGGILAAVITIIFRNGLSFTTVKKSACLGHDIALSGASAIIQMATLLASAQLVIMLIQTTGFGVKLSDLIISIGQNSLFFCLILSMIVCIVLGMGLPTTAAYVLSAAVMAPALIALGMKPLVAHLFVFYFSTLATITPPVCAAVYLSAGMANANWMKTGILSVMIALPAFIIPYTFAYNEALLLHGTFVSVSLSVCSAIIGVCAIGMGVAGYAWGILSILRRGLIVCAGVMLVIPWPVISVVGLILGGVVLFWKKRTPMAGTV